MTILTQGIILRSDHHRDYDRRYTIYTKDFGKMVVVARGAKKILSKLSPHLGSFLIINLMIAPGRGLDYIAGAQITKNYSAIGQDLNKVVFASYFLETVDTLIKDQYEDQVVFGVVDNFLEHLHRFIELTDQLLILNKSLFELLRHLGYQPQIKAKSQKDLFGQFHKIIMEAGDQEVKSYDLLLAVLNNLKIGSK